MQTRWWADVLLPLCVCPHLCFHLSVCLSVCVADAAADDIDEADGNHRCIRVRTSRAETHTHTHRRTDRDTARQREREIQRIQRSETSRTTRNLCDNLMRLTDGISRLLYLRHHHYHRHQQPVADPRGGGAIRGHAPHLVRQSGHKL